VLLVYGNLLYYNESDKNPSCIFLYILICGYVYVLSYIHEIFSFYEFVNLRIPLGIGLIFTNMPNSLQNVEIIEKLPKGIFNKTEIKNEYECVICLTKYKENDEIKFLPCDPRHFFHSKCIDQWLLQNLICPLCHCEINTDKVLKGKNFKENMEFIKNQDQNIINN